MELNKNKKKNLKTNDEEMQKLEKVIIAQSKQTQTRRDFNIIFEAILFCLNNGLANFDIVSKGYNKEKIKLLEGKKIRSKTLHKNIGHHVAYQKVVNNNKKDKDLYNRLFYTPSRKYYP